MVDSYFHNRIQLPNLAVLQVGILLQSSLGLLPRYHCEKEEETSALPSSTVHLSVRRYFEVLSLKMALVVAVLVVQLVAAVAANTAIQIVADLEVMMPVAQLIGAKSENLQVGLVDSVVSVAAVLTIVQICQVDSAVLELALAVALEALQ